MRRLYKNRQQPIPYAALYVQILACTIVLTKHELLLILDKKIHLLFKSWHPNLVCSKSGIRRTNPRHPEYRLKWPGIRRTKKAVFTLIHCVYNFAYKSTFVSRHFAYLDMFQVPNNFSRLSLIVCLDHHCIHMYVVFIYLFKSNCHFCYIFVICFLSFHVR